MLDLKWIRENPDNLKQGLEAKGVRGVDVAGLLELDKERRTFIKEGEDLKSKRNSVSEEVARLKAQGKSADTIIADMKLISQKIKEFDAKVGELDEKIAKITLIIPNIPHESVPIAVGNKGNKVVRTWGEPRKLPFKAKGHLDLIGDPKKKDAYLLSMGGGSKITGAAFPVYREKGALLERALINFMIDLHVSKHGYTEIWPPALVNRASMTGTGQLPKMEEDMYKLKDDDYFLIPTAEVPVTNLYREEILNEEDLPIKHVAYTPCFRREAGSYGKDTQGLSRVHQFDKVEMVKFVKPEDSMKELESLVANAETVLQALELPYRVLLLGSGDMSFAAAKCYDLEAYAPGADRWFEVSSCSVFGDFQARRMELRFRRKASNKIEYVHTLNGSGVALARTVLCLVENFQSQDGKVDFANFPKALRPYLSYSR